MELAIGGLIPALSTQGGPRGASLGLLPNFAGRQLTPKARTVNLSMRVFKLSTSGCYAGNVQLNNFDVAQSESAAPLEC